ncbi:MAG: hypothetical protein HPY85_13725 [Anaerolineae bacterium]|nr:hypothetical protein [Anaerolineae bacterium]
MNGLNWTNLAFLLLIGASLAMLLTENWRLFIACLALQYLAVFALISLQWSIGLAAVKLVVGWMSCAILGASQPRNELLFSYRAGTAGLLFRFLSALVVWLLVFSFAPGAADWLPVGNEVLFQGLLLAGMGLLQIALSTRRIRSVVGLLSIISGFEIIYAALSDSVLVTGLLGSLTLGIALIGAWWMHFLPEEEMSA